jgi:hypothetical protein
LGALYPGPYYDVHHHLVSADVGRSVLLMRLFNVVVATVLLGAVLAVADRGTRGMVTLGFLGSVVPLGLFIIASVNPSSWALTGVTVTWASLHVLLGSRNRGTLVGSTILYTAGVAMAAASRGDAGAYVVVVSAAIVLLRGRGARTRPWLLAVPLAGALVGLSSFVAAQQTQVLATGWAGPEGRSGAELWFNNLTELPGLVAGSFGVGPLGRLGWFDTAMPAATSAFASLVFGGLFFLGFRCVTSRKLAAVAGITVVVLAAPLYVLQISGNFVGENVQPRYLLPLLPALLGVSLAGRRSGEVVRPSRTQAVLAYVLLVVAHSTALHATIRRFVTGSDVRVFNLEPTEWWWSSAPSPMVVWALGTGAFAVLATAVLLVSAPGDSRSPEQRTAPDRAAGGRSAAAEPSHRLARGRITDHPALLEDKPP